MTGIEIFNLIQDKKQQIQNLFDPTVFVLKPEIVQLEQDITELQNQCEHEYVNKVCKYCGKEKQQ